jgi:hypothetical protein
MALKFKYLKREEIPTELVAHYAERDGAWQLDCEPLQAATMEEKRKLEEFRQTNITLSKQLEDQKRRFEGIDPDAMREAVEAKRKLDEGELLKKGDIDAVLQPRLAPILKRATDAEERLSELLVNQGAITAATKRGLRATAVPDLTLRARGAFKVVNGNAVAVASDGTPKAGKDGVTPMSFDEWAENLVVEAPHLFESNSGGGAAGGVLAHGHQGKNPWRKDSWNVTEQMKLLRAEPKQAECLRLAAGC